MAEPRGSLCQIERVGPERARKISLTPPAREGVTRHSSTRAPPAALPRRYREENAPAGGHESPHAHTHTHIRIAGPTHRDPEPLEHVLLLSDELRRERRRGARVRAKVEDGGGGRVGRGVAPTSMMPISALSPRR